MNLYRVALTHKVALKRLRRRTTWIVMAATPQAAVETLRQSDPGVFQYEPRIDVTAHLDFVAKLSSVTVPARAALAKAEEQS